MSNFSNLSAWDNLTSQSSSFFSPLGFWIYVFSEVASLLCTLFVLFHLLFNRILRHTLSNHVMIILLFTGLLYELTTVPWLLYRFRYGDPWISTPIFYLFSFFFDYGIYSTQIILFAWASIERHILTFHEGWVLTMKKRFFAHYLPIIVILIYCILFYSLIAFAPFCETSFDQYIVFGILIPCLFSQTSLGLWDLYGHQCVSTVIIVIASISLIIRVVRQKRRLNQPVRWRRYRKMTIQLLSVSILYLIFNVPGEVVVVISRFGTSENVTAVLLKYISFSHSYIIFLFPFVCCASLPELREKLKRMLRWRGRRRIVAQGPLQRGEIITRWTVKPQVFIH